MPAIGLKTKMTVAVSIMIVSMITLLAFFTLRYFEKHFKETISHQQITLVSVIADDIDDKLQDAHGLIINLARSVTRNHLDNPGAAKKFLTYHTEPQQAFNNGLYLFNRVGALIATTSLHSGHLNKDCSFSDYIKVTLSSGKPYISKPCPSPGKDQQPAVMFTAPVTDRQGAIIGILAGSLDLTRGDFLGRIASTKIGRSGYLYVFDSDRTMIMHPDRTRVLKQDLPPGANRLLDRGVAGYEGTDENVNSRRHRALASFKRLKTTNWIIGANFPADEAYAALYTAQKVIGVMLAPTIIVTVLIIMLLMNRMTAPLRLFARHVEELPNRSGAGNLIHITTGDEIEVLANSFNRMMEELDRREIALKEREELYRTVADFSLGMVFWVNPCTNKMLYISPSCERITGYADAEFLAAPSLLDHIIHPDDRNIWHDHSTVAEAGNFAEPIEVRIVTKDGMVRWVNHFCRPVFAESGSFMGVRGSFSDMTARKQAEEEQKQQLYFLQTLIDAIPAPIFYKDAHGVYLGCNRAFQAYIGLAKSEVVGKTVFDIAPPELAQVYFDADNALLQRPGVQCYEASVRYAEGTIRDVMFYKASFTREDGTVGGLVGTLLDITERNKAEIALRASEEKFRLFFEESRDAIFVSDADFRIVYANQSTIDLLGYPNEEMDGLNVCETFCENLCKDNVLAELHEKGYVRDRELRLRRKDGSRVVCLLTSSLRKSADGEVLGCQSILHDITDRVWAEEELRKLYSAVQQSPVSVIVTDLKGNTEYVNPKFTEVTGYSQEDVIGRNMRILKSGEMPHEEYQRLWDTITAGEVWQGELHNRKKNGEPYWEDAKISPIRDTKGDITHYLAVKEDVTERKKLEGKLIQSQKMEAVGRLAGGIAHDFNNIMTAIIGYTSVVEMKLDRESPLRNNLQQIKHVAERAANLTQGLLAFSRQQITNPRPVNLNDTVSRIDKLLTRLIGEDIEMKTSLAERPLVIVGDSLQLEQVLMNLATNARDAMPEGGCLTISSEPFTLDNRFIAAHGFGTPGPYVLLSVADAGAGMDEETKKKIFEPFFTTKEVGKGTGLGLSIVYGIVKKHNGFITCYSEPGKGTVFNLFFPAVQLPVEEPVQEPSLQQCGGTETILLAEDNVPVRKYAKDLLEDYGYTVWEAVDGEDAVLMFRENREQIQLLIFDVIMPKKNGKEAYEEIRKIKPDVKALFCSGYTSDIIHAKGILETELNYLAKPLSPEKLLTKVREVLDR